LPCEGLGARAVGPVALTPAPCRDRFGQRLRVAIEHLANPFATLAVISVGLDQFSRICDSLGRSTADLVLTWLAQRLVTTVTRRGFAERTGDDRVAILLPGADATEAAAEGARILSALSETIDIDGIQLCVQASVGIAMFPQDGEDAETLLCNADAAQRDVQRPAWRGCRFFTPQSRLAARKRITLEVELRRAIGRGELELQYQPKICLQTGRLSGAEALIRWRSPTYGAVPPEDFIPLAEECGLIRPLGEWVFDEACGQISRWRERNEVDVAVAVNVSAAQLCGQQSIDTILETLARHQVPPQLLEIEMTESAAIREVPAAGGLRTLAGLGVKLTVDDFGTGYSNLDLLRRLPVSTIKIDRSFIHGIENARDGAIVHAIIEMAHALDLRVVAEGVETQQQLVKLRLATCDDIQGYLIARPLSPQAFALWVAERLLHTPRHNPA
jgi:diguanylate cyclase (GGDEF)-like protein